MWVLCVELGLCGCLQSMSLDVGVVCEARRLQCDVTGCGCWVWSQASVVDVAGCGCCVWSQVSVDICSRCYWMWVLCVEPGFCGCLQSMLLDLGVVCGAMLLWMSAVDVAGSGCCVWSQASVDVCRSQSSVDVWSRCYWMWVWCAETGCRGHLQSMLGVL
jgi:hypothetical protein